MIRSGCQITVVVASYKRPDALPTLLGSLQRQTLPASQFAVSVVIDGIDDSKAEYDRVLERVAREVGFAFHYEFQQNAGQSVARHRAIAAAASRWICVVDDDMDLLPEFLEGHLEALESGGDKTVVIGRVIPEDGWERAPLYEAVRTSHMLEWHESLGSGLRQPTGFTLVTQNVSFSRALYLDVGGFDPELRLGEDSELGLRFEFAGGRFVFAHKAAAIHRSRIGSYDAWLRRCVDYGRNGVYIYQKLGRDLRAHPLRNLVTGSRLNAAAVHTLCWSDTLTRTGIVVLHRFGNGLQRLGLMSAAIATHKAILSLAFHLGVKDALGSWRGLVQSERAFASAPTAPSDPT